VSPKVQNFWIKFLKRPIQEGTIKSLTETSPSDFFKREKEKSLFNPNEPKNSKNGKPLSIINNKK
jgi:hypothetical protein